MFGVGALRAYARAALEHIDGPGSWAEAAAAAGRRPPGQGKSVAERSREYRANKRHGPPRSATLATDRGATDDRGGVAADRGAEPSRAPTVSLESLSTSQQILEQKGSLVTGGPGGSEQKTATVGATVTATVAASVAPTVAEPAVLHIVEPTVAKAKLERKKPKTYCPGTGEGAEALDRWCRGQGLPPASEVPMVLDMVIWHRKNSVPRGEWLATWQGWQRSPLNGAHAVVRVGSQGPTEAEKGMARMERMRREGGTDG